MLSKNKIKYFKSLLLKKYRDREGVFVVEGDKAIFELLKHFEPELLLVDPDKTTLDLSSIQGEVIETKLVDIAKVSALKNPRPSFAIFKQMQATLEQQDLENKLSLVLDGVQDPGNLGTIIRNAVWFGIENVICSLDTVDVYNPKVVQATMGALARVRVIYTDLQTLLSRYKGPIYGTYLEGDNIYQQKLDPIGIVVMGNEGSGIRKELKTFVTNKLFIPPYPVDANAVESLNVATASAIICSEFRRILIHTAEK